MDRGDCQQELCRKKRPRADYSQESLVFAGLDGGVGVGGVKREHLENW